MRIEASDSLSRKLGFSKILRCGTDIRIGKAESSHRQATISTGSENILARAVKERDVIGIFAYNPSKRLLAALAESGKTLFINVNSVITAAQPQQLKSIYLLRKGMLQCRQFRVSVCPVTMAAHENEMLSARQLMSVIKFLGFSGDAKKALSVLGAVNGKKHKE